tara:strand:+ start:1742 stop:2626 length:885 start_codon:yes stop_codon:yes gene_type:complete
MKLIFKEYILFALFLYSALIELSAADWHRGILQLDAAERGVYFKGYSSGQQALHSLEFPNLFSGLGEFLSVSEAGVDIKLSTRIYASWKGPGLFAVDQFEHKWIWGSEKESPELMVARSIFHIDDGTLFLDASQMTEGSILVIENPLGKIISRDAVFSIQVEDFKGKGKKHCFVNCYGGSLQIFDTKGNSYEVEDGFKLILMLQDNFTKVDNSLMTESELSSLGDFKNRWTDLQPFNFPILKSPEGKRPVADTPNLVEEAFELDDYFIPLMKPINTFRPYKGSVDLSLEYLELK